MRKPLLFCLLAVSMLTLSQPLASVQADTRANFNGECEVSFEWQRPFVVSCRSDTLEPVEGYNNRYRFLLDSAPIDLTLPRTADYVTAAAIDGGWIMRPSL